MEETPRPVGDRLAKVRWASRVNPRLIRRLYETDARGIVDEELIDEVGVALYARCESILQANEAHIHGRVLCPECGQTIQRPLDVWRDRSKPVTCDRCGWSVRWGDYLATYQDKHLVSVGAIAMHQAFVRDFRRAATPREKMLAIEIAEIAGGKFAMQLKTKYTKVARRFSLRPLVSNAVLKTLSYIIHLQPVSSKDLADRRGPQAYGHLKQLLELGFIHAERSGRTRIFRTTSTFSEYFGLSDDPDKIRRRLAAPQKRDAQKL